MSGVVTVRIFLASPQSDTVLAREAVVKAVLAIGADPAYRRRFQLDLLRWDDAMRGLVFEAAGSPQRAIEVQIGKPGECDLVIGLFAHTMGGFLDVAHYGKHQKEDRPWHCTEWEIQEALEGREAGRVREVWLYKEYSDQPAPDRRWSPDEKDAHRKRSTDVERFLEKLSPNLFTDPANLLEQMGLALRNWLNRQWPEAAVPALAPVPALPPAPVAVDPRRARECLYLGQLVNRHFHDRETRYVPLAGEQSQEQRMERVLVDPVMPTEILLELFADTDLLRSHTAKPPKPVPYQDVLDAYRALPQRGAVRRLAVLGEPGAGKSFSLQRIACELARAAQADASRPVPVLAAMGLWNKPLEADSLDAFLARQLGVPLEDWHALVGEGRALLLLDAINEIPPGQRKAKVAQIKALVRDTRLAAVVLSCRERDFEADFQLPFDRLKLLPLRPAQILEFLRRTLALVYGAEVGERLAQDKFWQIAGGDFGREVWRTWEVAGASFELFWSATDIPRKDPNVFSKTSGEQDAWWKRAQSERGLIRLAANPYLLTMMMRMPAIPPNRARLFTAFLKVLHDREHETRTTRLDSHTVPTFETWRAVLVRVAEALQRVDGATGDDGARTALSQAEWPEALTEELLAFSIDASVLQRVGGDVRFTHQLLQESLAADVLLDASRSGRRPASDFWPEQRGWKRTGWEVVAEIAGEACGADEAAQHKLIEWLSASAPKVAADVWRYLNRPALPAELRQVIADQWCPRLTDTTTEPVPESRAAIGEWLGALDLDHRPGTGLRPDGLPDIEWVLIDDDLPFRYQDTTHPPLPRYEISRYPVTNRQWQAFIDDGGYDNSRWWEGLAKRMEPRAPQRSEPTAPRETVSWYEAMAYGRWLSAKLNQRVTLPTEQQWERAARGSEGREYPWRGKDYVPGLANINETWTSVGTHNVGRTTAVGLYPHGATPEGIQDMAGNVWEWCLNEYENPQNIDPTGTARRVLRGGSWSFVSGNCRAAYRFSGAPDGRHDGLGLRLVRRRRVPHSES
jgi:Sulfatase-modifying factor enzyme 1/NACHT domain